MNIAQTTPTVDPRPFIRHMDLARAWCRWNGQQGTERQTLRVMQRLTAATLEQMLAKRGVTIDKQI